MNFHNSNTQLETSSQATTELGVRVCASLSRVAREGVDVHRDLAIKALGRIGDRAAVPALIEALRDPDEDVRTDAAEALSALADPRAAGPLMESLLGDPCDDVKLNAIAALARLRDPKLTPWLIRLLKGRDEELVWDETEFHETGWDDWTDIQIKAIEALGELGAIEANLTGPDRLVFQLQAQLLNLGDDPLSLGPETFSLSYTEPSHEAGRWSVAEEGFPIVLPPRQITFTRLRFELGLELFSRDLTHHIAVPGAGPSSEVRLRLVAAGYGAPRNNNELLRAVASTSQR